MEQKGLKVAVFFSLIVMLCLVVASLYTMFKIVPGYVKAYQLMGQSLPFITRVCFKMSAVVNKTAMIVVPILLLLISGSVIMAIAGRNKMLWLKSNTAVAILAFLFIVFCYFATDLPARLMEKESQRQFAAEGLRLVPSEQVK